MKRYKRFLADVQLEDGSTVTAHCANPGSMLGLKDPDSTVWLSPVPKDSPRKLRYTWELIDCDGAMVGINTNLPNHLVEEALKGKVIKELAAYNAYRREVKYGQNSRIDVLLSEEGLPDCYVEIKNVHLRRGNLAEFPDSVTARGAKHLRELTDMVKEGHRAVMLYVVQRADCEAFKLAEDIDPNYAYEAQKAFAAGVEKLCYYCQVTQDGISIKAPLPYADN